MWLAEQGPTPANLQGLFLGLLLLIATCLRSFAQWISGSDCWDGLPTGLCCRICATYLEVDSKYVLSRHVNIRRFYLQHTAASSRFWTLLKCLIKKTVILDHEHCCMLIGAVYLCGTGSNAYNEATVLPRLMLRQQIYCSCRPAHARPPSRLVLYSQGRNTD